MFFNFYKNLIYSIRNTEFIFFAFLFVLLFFSSVAFYFLSRESLLLNEVVVPDGIEYVVEEGGIRVSNRLTFYFRGVSYSASCGIEGVDNINPCNKNFYNKKLIGYNVKIIEIFEDSRRNIVGLLVNGDFKEKDKSSMYHFIRDEDFFNNELRQEKFKVYVHKITFIIFLIGAFISLVCLFISAKYNLFFRNGD